MRVRTAVGVAALLIGVWAAPAGAGFEPGTLSVTPPSGPLGTDFTVSGDQCDGGAGEWRVYPVDSDELLVAGGDIADESGTWQDGFPTGPTGPVTTPGTYVVEADCAVDEEVLFSYQPVTITVTAPPDTTPPDTAPPAESSTSTTAAAAAAAAQPTFTG